jgi:hypothetical protein
MTTTDETRVREVLHRATDDLGAPVHQLTEAAAIGGRRLRRRRRAVAAAGAVCVAVLVAVPVAVTLGGTGASRTSGFASDPGSPTATASPTPIPLPEEARWTRMPATTMLTELKRLMPDGMSLADPITTNADAAPGERERLLRSWLMARVVVDGHTAGAVNVLLMPPGEASNWTTCPGNLDSPDSCTELTEADGTTIGRRSTSTMGDVTVLEEVLRGPGGGLVYVAATNSDDDKWGADSTIASDTVPLTIEQVDAIASAEAWTTWEPKR